MKQAFATRRKMLRRALAGFGEQRTAAALAAAGLAGTERAEELSVAAFRAPGGRVRRDAPDVPCRSCPKSRPSSAAWTRCCGVGGSRPCGGAGCRCTSIGPSTCAPCAAVAVGNIVRRRPPARQVPAGRRRASSDGRRHPSGHDGPPARPARGGAARAAHARRLHAEGRRRAAVRRRAPFRLGRSRAPPGRGCGAGKRWGPTR